ncbi:sensor histidine kinase [Natranaerofaba carboxydovora]|uniref:sensor histidine kinase n=1 Tax=Natranaerofaba carboxydovora TaxID=2742683 RepID=UPI001F14733A|nr:sensor histidine kinase [Natranaerofaba carboxydovora]UMZ75041.1 Signal transduction histidine-protein kinase/phosphatase DegS [Natranaerofaba carboxydovora]
MPEKIAYSKNKIEGLDFNSIDEVLKKTISSIQDGKVQIFEITESARNEHEQLKRDLIKLKNQTTEVIKEVDKLEKKYYRSRLKLAEVSKNFDTYLEKNIKEAYEQANDLRAKLNVMKEREYQIRHKRNETEMRLRNLKKTIEKAEKIMNQLGVIESYLSQGLGGLQETLQDLEKRKDIGTKIIRAQEEERRRVAREIHDGPAQSLANMVFRAEYCEKLIDAGEKPKTIKEELAELKAQVRENLKDVRKIIFDLRPMTLDDLGLVPAIRRLIQGVEEDTNIKGELKVFGEEQRFNRDLEIALFRTVQEALNNIKKHSEAKTFWIKAEFGEDKVQINIRDDGKGFDSNWELENIKSEKFGLTNMRERVMSLGGDININSKHQKGTRISIKVPIPGVEEGEEVYYE